MSNVKPDLRSINAYNLHTLRTQPLAELSGSLGDLGTLLPILTALSISHAISLPSTLIFTGLANILTGVFFGIPLPVQPMKAIAAVALTRNFGKEDIAAAGIVVAAVVGVLSVTGLLKWFNRVVPVPVVKGIQVGAGLSLCLSAGTTLAGLGWTTPRWQDNLLWAVFAFAALLVTISAPRVPYALLLLMLGLVFAAVGLRGRSSSGEGNAEYHFPPHIPIVVPSWKVFWHSTITASLGQLPLTTLNSIIAVTHLSSDLLPNVPEPSVTAVGLSVAGMNLVSCWFGSMPACHGSGGLAAQYRFGARSGASIIILGTVKLLLGLFAGEGLVSLLEAFPRSFLGIMVIVAGIELAKVGESLNVGARDLWEDAENEAEGGYSAGRAKKFREPDEQERKERWAIMLVTVAFLLAFKNDAVGFLAGMFWHWGLRVSAWMERRQSNRRFPAWLDNITRSSAAERQHGEGQGLLSREDEARMA